MKCKDLINSILQHMAGEMETIPPVPPPLNLHMLPAYKALTDFEGVDSPGARDPAYWFPDEEVWVDLWYDAHNECPDYESITEDHPGFDCDKFARNFCASCNKKKINGCWEVWGDTPFGYHAWNVIQTPNGKLELEPQSGDAWVFGSNPDWKIRKRM